MSSFQSLLPVGRTGEASGPYNKSDARLKIGERQERKYFYLGALLPNLSTVMA
jgi:hypothetical protein